MSTFKGQYSILHKQNNGIEITLDIDVHFNLYISLAVNCSKIVTFLSFGFFLCKTGITVSPYSLGNPRNKDMTYIL